ncbi:MAG: ABC transporter substrate-binding protein [Spirochaetales bacterium]
MKKIILGGLFAITALVVFVACSPSNNAASSGKNEIIIGAVSDLNGDMMSGWTNLSPNKQVKTLLHEYGATTVVFTKEGTFEENPSVLDGNIQTTMNADGTKTFVITIKDDLVYNDGSAITAKDYVFGILLGSSPEFGGLDADNFGGEQYVGFDAFNAGETKTFSGIRLLSDTQFSITVKAEELPYYYDITFVAAGPSPMAVIAPGVELTDNGNGATLSDAFTVELLEKTINDTATGYRYAPKVTSGPYQFVSFDPTSLQAVLEINPNYCGTYDGVQPSIQRLIFKSVIDATMMDEIASGSVDLIAGVSGGDRINAGLDLADDGVVGYTYYPRAGYGKIVFSCNFGPTQFATVRQAIAYCLDRDEFAKEYTGGFGQVTDGYYGLSQWEYQTQADEVAVRLEHYTRNLDKAEEILINDGWTLNAQGGTFVKGTDAVRYKRVNGELMGLEIEWANTPNNPVSDLISRMLPSAMASVGMKLNPTTLEFGPLIEALQQTGGLQNYHMYNLATGFATTSAVWYYYNKDLATYGGAYNQAYIADDELHNIAQSMKATPSGDDASWAAKWLDLQERWNYLVPELPLYSDEYYEFFNPSLQNYTPDALWATDYAIIYANMN